MRCAPLHGAAISGHKKTPRAGEHGRLEEGNELFLFTVLYFLASLLGLPLGCVTTFFCIREFLRSYYGHVVLLRFDFLRQSPLDLLD